MHLSFARIASLALALALAPPALAGIGADAVVPDAEIDRLGLFDCALELDDGFAACLAAHGVAQPAIDAAMLITGQSDGMLGLLEGFDERGTVDLATVFYPDAANANTRVAFVNGTVPVVLAADLTVPPPDTGNGNKLRKRYPDWMAAGPMEFAGYRDLPDGAQRFMLIDRITEGCRACEVIAISVTAVDFRGGALAGVTTLEWVPPAAALDGEAALAALRAGRMDVLQYRLLVAGHEVGGADGVPGPATRRALGDFLTGNCLPDAAPGSLDEESLTVLAGLAPAPCD